LKNKDLLMQAKGGKVTERRVRCQPMRLWITLARPRSRL